MRNIRIIRRGGLMLMLTLLLAMLMELTLDFGYAMCVFTFISIFRLQMRRSSDAGGLKCVKNM